MKRRNTKRKRRSTRRRIPKKRVNTIKRIVRAELNKNSETKIHVTNVNENQCRQLTRYTGQYDRIPQGTTGKSRVGAEVTVKGLHIRHFWTKTGSDLQDGYIRLVIGFLDTDIVLTDDNGWDMFRDYDNTDSTTWNGVVTLNQSADRDLLWKKIDPKHFKVIWDKTFSIGRYTNTVNNDSRQKNLYVNKFFRLNYKIKYDAVTTGQNNQTQRLVSMWWYVPSDFNGVSSDDPQIEHSSVNKIYFKDL